MNTESVHSLKYPMTSMRNVVSIKIKNHNFNCKWSRRQLTFTVVHIRFIEYSYSGMHVFFD